MTITFEDFLKTDIRVGKIVKAEEFPQARNPSYKLYINFGSDIGERKTSAQITHNYTLNELENKLIAAVVNFPPKQIGPFMSEVLVLGFPDENGHVTLISPDKDIPLGGRLH
jgi:tRNA-binding protein